MTIVKAIMGHKELSAPSDIVYHATYNILDILKTNELRLSHAGNKKVERKLHGDSNIKNSNDYYLSTARNMASRYVNGKGLVLELDGRKLGQRFKSKAINYWQGYPWFSESEQEDRILYNKPAIKNASKYIKAIHVTADEYSKDRLMEKILPHLAYYEKKLKIPVHVYENEQQRALRKKGKSLADLGVKPAVPSTRQKHTPVSVSDITALLVAYKLITNYLKKPRDITLKEYVGKKVKDNYLVNTALGLNNYGGKIELVQIQNVLHNANTDKNDMVVKGIDRLNKIAKAHGTDSIPELFEYLNSEYVKVKEVTDLEHNVNRYKKFIKDKVMPDFYDEEGLQKSKDRAREAKEKTKNTWFTTMSKQAQQNYLKKHKGSNITDFLVQRNGKWVEKANDSLHQDALEKTGFWGKVGAGCLVYCSSTNRFLLAHRSPYVQEPNTWGIFGGAIDPKEKPVKAALRELKEETGYRLKPTDIDLLYLFRDVKSGFKYYNFLIEVEKEFTPRLDWENQGYRWCKLNQLPNPLHDKVKLMLNRPEVKRKLKEKLQPQKKDGSETASMDTFVLPKVTYLCVDNDAIQSLATKENELPLTYAIPEKGYAPYSLKLFTERKETESGILLAIDSNRLVKDYPNVEELIMVPRGEKTTQTFYKVYANDSVIENFSLYVLSIDVSSKVTPDIREELNVISTSNIPNLPIRYYSTTEEFIIGNNPLNNVEMLLPTDYDILEGDQVLDLNTYMLAHLNKLLVALKEYDTRIYGEDLYSFLLRKADFNSNQVNELLRGNFLHDVKTILKGKDFSVLTQNEITDLKSFLKYNSLKGWKGLESFVSKHLTKLDFIIKRERNYIDALAEEEFEEEDDE